MAELPRPDQRGRGRKQVEQAISFYDPECRDSISLHPRCPGTCCSNCTNLFCDFPRGVLYHVRGKYKVKFKKVDGQILCMNCAVFRSKHGTWRSEAAQSKLDAAHRLGSSAKMSPMNEKILRRQSDPDWCRTKPGESVSYDLSALLTSVCVTC